MGIFQQEISLNIGKKITKLWGSSNFEHSLGSIEKIIKILKTNGFTGQIFKTVLVIRLEARLQPNVGFTLRRVSAF